MNYTLLWKPRKLIAAIKVRLNDRPAMEEAIRLAEARFRGDPNYEPARMQKCFVTPLGTPVDDSAILQWIVAAYQKAKAQQRLAEEAFSVSNEWLHIYTRRLGGVMEALESGDIEALQGMYRNFFRDPCSTGLVGVPIEMPGGDHPGEARKYLITEVLHRYYLWKERTGGTYATEVLSTPSVGNPFGYTMDGVFIRACGDYQHYYAQAIRQMLGQHRVVAELGGGFGVWRTICCGISRM